MKLNCHYYYNSLTEFLNHIQQQKQHLNDTSHDLTNPQWSGTQTYQDAIYYATMGWQQGIQETTLLYQQIKHHIHQTPNTPILQYNQYGDLVDPGRYNQGDPECMLQYTQYPNGYQPKPTKHILINLTASTHIPQQAYYLRGITAILLTEILETQGYPVQITATEAITPTHKKNGHYQIDIILKQSHQPIHKGQLLFALSNVGMLRRLLFHHKEQEPTQIRNHYGFTPKGNYGKPTTPTINTPPDIYLPAMKPSKTHNWKNPDDVQKWLLKILKQQNVNIH